MAGQIKTERLLLAVEALLVAPRRRVDVAHRRVLRFAHTRDVTAEQVVLPGLGVAAVLLGAARPEPDKHTGADRRGGRAAGRRARGGAAAGGGRGGGRAGGGARGDRAGGRRRARAREGAEAV